MQDKDTISRGWLILPWLALALALPSALASLPPFRFGYWDKAEPIAVWLHLCGGLGAVGLAAGCLAGRGTLCRAVLHPYVLAPLGLALWSLLAAPFVQFPLLSLAGVAQNGFGVFWFLDMAVLVACALAVRRDAGLWRALSVVAVLAVLVVSGIKLADLIGQDLDNTILLYVPSYYAWPGTILPILAGGWLWRRGNWPAAVAVSAVALLSVSVSLSYTAWGLLLGGGALVLAGTRRERSLLHRLAHHRFLAVAVVGAVTLLLPLALRVASPWVDSASLLDRIHLQDMVLAALRAEPAWVFGHGWGRVQDAFHAQLNVTGENLWQPTWIFLFSDYFSAHNWLLDTAHAAGIPGVLMHLACFLVIPWFAAPAARPAATALALAYGVIMTVWFMLGFSVPFFALAMAAVAGPLPSGRAIGSVRLLGGGLAVLAVAQMGLGLRLADFARSVSAVRADLRAEVPAGRPWPIDPRGSDLEVTESIRDAFNELAQAGEARPARLPAIRAMLDVLRRRIPETGTVQMPIAGLGVLSYIHLSRELAWLEPELAGSRELWRAWLDRLLLLAPGRTDQAIAYLTERAMAGDLSAVNDLSARLLRTAPRDPVGLYFQGLYLVLSPDPAAKQRGIQLFRAAREAGIERFMPLDPAIKGLIGPA